ncbi:helix-hairpin-helix domain-containing protein [bacterium]|nr:helix-hairpin-helix domain-containing protein [bacterium]RQV94321.1 MAG: helix-hairpin-helix domain-containing protein [bacterium]
MLGFTRNEKMVLLFLAFGFIIGMGVWIYRQYYGPVPIISDYVFNQELFSSEKVNEKEINPEETKNPNLLVSINKATQEQLEYLPGIGPVMASRIIAYRDQHHGFSTIDELVEIKGIGEKTVEKLRPYIQIVE